MRVQNAALRERLPSQELAPQSVLGFSGWFSALLGTEALFESILTPSFLLCYSTPAPLSDFENREPATKIVNSSPLENSSVHVLFTYYPLLRSSPLILLNTIHRFPPPRSFPNVGFYCVGDKKYCDRSYTSCFLLKILCIHMTWVLIVLYSSHVLFYWLCMLFYCSSAYRVIHLVHSVVKYNQKFLSQKLTSDKILVKN